MLSGLWTRLSVAAAIAGLIGITLLRIFAAGKRSERVDRMEERLEAIAVQKEVANEIRAADPGANRQRLRDDWSR